jgi:serine/threonine protein kinase
MELMHQTLEKYLSKNRGTLPMEKQVDICYQISCGLLFLHQYDPQILHRDVTAKNILLNEDGSIVKISDLGQAKFRPSNIQYLSTKAPGCIVYMPPECLGDHPRFTAKSDTFSFGVVMLHVFTQEPPSCGLMNIGAKPEIERRADDLSKLSDDHPHKSLVVACLDDDPNKRPDMSEVQSTLGSVLAVENLQKTGNSDCIEGYQKLKSELSKDEKIFRSEQLLQDNSTLHSLKLPNLPIPTCWGTVTRIGRTLYVSGGVGPDWESARLVQSFDLETATWSTLPPSPVVYSEAAVINGHLTLIGGWDPSTEKLTNQVWSWDEEDKEWRNTIPSMPTPRWRHGVVQTSSVVAVLGGRGSDGTLLSTVDVLHTATLQWTTSPLLKLPLPMWGLSTATCDGHLYIACGRDRVDHPTKSTFKLSLDLLEQSVAKQHVQDDSPQWPWTEVKNTPFYSSGLLPTSHHPLVVGGCDSSNNSSSVISVFDSSANKWSNVGHCSVACCRPCLLSVSSSSFLVLGGCTDPKNVSQSFLNTCELYYF